MKRIDRRRALAALPVLLALGGCGTGEADEAGPAIQTVSAERGDLRITAEATGTVEPIRRVEVKSKASGEILRLHVDVGDEVEPGALLAEVDPRDVRNRYDQTEADLEVAQARADITEAQLERSEQLHESGVITDQELENARLEYSNAQADLTRARTNHELAEIQLGDVRIQAPMAGTILEKNVEEGVVIQSASQNVSGGTTLFVMASLDQMQVRTLVDETDMGEIEAGMTAQVTVEAFPDRVFRGAVEKVEPQAVVEQNVTMFPVIVELDNRMGFLKPGMNAEVEVLIDQASDVLLVPNNAVVSPQDAVPAAMALGLDPDDLDMSAFGPGRFARRMAGEAGAPGEPGGRRAAGEAGPTGAGAGQASESEGAGAAGPAGPMAAFRDSIRSRVEAGELSQDSARALFRARMSGALGPADRGGAVVDRPGFVSGERQTRRAVVFTVDSAGTPAPKLVEIGLNDWDRTQVVSGLEEGQRIAVVGAAQLQAQQAEFLERIRSRTGGPFGR